MSNDLSESDPFCLPAFGAADGRTALNNLFHHGISIEHADRFSPASSGGFLRLCAFHDGCDRLLELCDASGECCWGHLWKVICASVNFFDQSFDWMFPDFRMARMSRQPRKREMA